MKPCGLGSRIRDVKTFWYKTEIIYFFRWCWLCVVVWFTLTLNFWYLKLKNNLVFFLRMEADVFWFYLITQDICNKFIEINFCFGRMVWLWLHLFQHWIFVKYWWDYFFTLYVTLRIVSQWVQILPFGSLNWILKKLQLCISKWFLNFQLW